MTEFHEFMVAILRSGTPLVYVTMAGVIAQRAGVWHLGLEGVMIIGACATILGIVLTGSFPAAIGIACMLCVAASVLLWFVIEKLGANPIIAGLGLTGLGIGGTALAVQALFGSLAAVTAPFGVPRLGAAFGPYGALSIFVLTMPFVVWGMWVLLRRTRFGLRLAAAGEHPLAARSVGTSPATARLIALAAGGILCALGAAHPIGAAFAAMFFSLVGVAGIRLQLLFGASIPHDVLLSLPYMATILGVWISGRMRGGAKAATEASELRDY